MRRTRHTHVGADAVRIKRGYLPSKDTVPVHRPDSWNVSII